VNPNPANERNPYLDVLWALVALSIIVLCVLVSYYTIHGARRAKRTIDKTDAALDGLTGLTKQGAGTLSTLTETTAALKGTIGTVNAGIGAETQLLQASTKELGKTERAFRALMDNTDKSINQPVDGLLPRLTETVRAADDSFLVFKSTVLTANEDLLEAQPGIKSFNAAMDNTNQLSQNLIDSAKQTTLIATNLAATTQNFRDVSQKFRDDYMKPVNRVWATFKGGLDLAYKLHSF
jgi:ABC-type transporter Mla subunit MlaD